ncbi:substrate-binding periplasmic protein [Rheinheimera maricola]|uniref:Transporter substrate-binding domain-containing protein n=1 Tax=Rheinheimera maricola TaxID=2793282 RepID=A0ABS7X4D8_9GAMM|nr:transporter substrate-binding domain-containing protein [Rheinheimera maricola]MBZ9610176.1 transporter substrate-binding domain-containing protein [Rheinheimera maricola]
MKTYMLLFAVACSLLTSCKPAVQQAAVAAPEPEPAIAACSFTMGIDAWEPYQYMTVGNTVAGLDVELVQNITTGMGCTLDVVQGSWLELLTLLREGKVDFVLGASKTEDRQRFAYFSEPYRQERFQLYVRKEDVNLPFTDLRSFITAGNKVGVVNEYYYGAEVSDLYADDSLRSNFVGAIISELNMARLLDDEIDGLLEDSFVGASILRRKGLDKYIQPHSISLGASDVYVMFSQASVSAEQVGQFNTGLAQLRESGAYNQIVDKYRN